ncbi:MAG: pirin family protein [Pseudohongiellaceae bacterium]|nr:pirin family protein [Pseudohongiellaceae bacterium]
MRQLTQLINATPTQDGDGVKIHRLAGRALHRVLDPFLMIDEINSDDAADYIGGFPEHPHRGFETITYMKQGRMRHRDHMGNEGVIGPGDVQWMTAGKGVLHSEMPEQQDGLLHGFQIWLNLPAAEKLKPASYRELLDSEVAKQELSKGGAISVITGKLTIQQTNDGQITLEGPMPALSTEPLLADVTLASNETVELSFNEEYPALVYVYQGNTEELALRNLGVYQHGDTLQLKASDQGAALLVLSGKPIKEPIAQYGPFVMNTMEEVEEAIKDFQSLEYIKQLKLSYSQP